MFSRCHESFEDNSHTGLRTQKTLYFDGFMDLVNVQKSNSSFSFLVFSQDSSLFKVKVHGWMAGEEKVSELLWGTKISCCTCNHRWSEPKGFKTWLIFNLLQLLLFDSATKIQTKQEGEKVCLLLKNADGFCLQNKKCVLVVCKFSKLHSKNAKLKNLRWHWIFNYRYTSLLAIFQST